MNDLMVKFRRQVLLAVATVILQSGFLDHVSNSADREALRGAVETVLRELKNR